MATVLLAEDNPLTARAVALALRRAGLRVTVVSNGEQALSEMEVGLPDLVITDIGMPRLDGIELLEHVRRMYPQVPIIALTGLRDLAEPEGFDAVVTKPCKPAALVGAVLQAIAEAERRDGRAH